MTRLSDVRAAFNRAREAAIQAGIGGAEHWTLQEGSPMYGRAWRLFRRDPANGGLHPPLTVSSGDYLGWSRAEAETALDWLARGIRQLTTLHP